MRLTPRKFLYEFVTIGASKEGFGPKLIECSHRHGHCDRPRPGYSRPLVAGVALSMFVPTLFAGDILDATVVKIASNKLYGEMVFIKTDKTKSSAPGCQTNLSWDFVMPLTTEHDKKLYAILLAARSAATPVSINGSGNCDTFGSIETVSGITW